jgi:MarR family transcriptional regulator, 2-MHQ and catechol-resistance regulon repressor
MSEHTTPTARPDTAPPGRVDPEYADALKLFTVLYRANAALQEKSRQDIQRHELTPAEFAVLEALYHRGPLLQGEIRSKILVSSGGITYLVDRLAERGLVERQDCPEDRRARYAALTKEGGEFMAGIFPEHARCLKRSMKGLSDDQKRQAIRLLRTLGKTAAEAPGCGEAPASNGKGDRGAG